MKYRMATESAHSKSSAPQMLVCSDWLGNWSECIKWERNFPKSRFLEILERCAAAKSRPESKSLSARLYLASSAQVFCFPQGRGIVASAPAPAPAPVLDSTLLAEPTLANFLHVGEQSEGGVLGR